MYSKIILILINCLVGVLSVFIDDEVEKNDKDPVGFPLSDDYDKFTFSVSLLEHLEELFRGSLSIDEFNEIYKDA